MNNEVLAKDTWNHGKRKNERAQKRKQENMNKKVEHKEVINGWEIVKDKRINNSQADDVGKDVQINNSFAVLDEKNEKEINLEEMEKQDKENSEAEKESTKPWVEKSFGKQAKSSVPPEDQVELSESMQQNQNEVLIVDKDGSSGSKINKGGDNTEQLKHQVINNTTIKINIEVVETDRKLAESVEGQEANEQSTSTSQEAVVEKVPKTLRSNPPQEIKDQELKEDLLNVQIDQVSRAADLFPRQTRKMRNSKVKGGKKEVVPPVKLLSKRLVNTQKSFERLTNLDRRNRYNIIGLMEPFEDAEQVERFRRKIGMETTFVNISGKIWLLLSEDVKGSVEIDNEHQITLKLFHQSLNCNIVLTAVYANFDVGERRMLWDSISHVSNVFYLPWLVGGDFNVIATKEEKLGGLPVLYNKVANFNHCLSSCGLQDLGYVGSTYTWWNGRVEEACIFKRLDRMVCNDKLLDVMPTMKVTHLTKKGSDHSPLELEFSTTTEVIIKPFKFLNFWVQHESFQEVIKQHWCIDFEGNPFTKFHHKLKKVKNALRNWSKNTYGNIFQQIASLEEVIKVHEEQFESSPTRNKLGVDNIQDADGNWLTNQEETSQEAVRCYQKQFEEDRIPSKFGLLKHIPTLVTEDQNHTMEMLPNEEEVKEAVFALNGESACGPDGFTGLFFQSCWEIVKLDVVDMVKAFFVGKELPRFITHTNLILIPKKEQVQSFSDLRPISLCNFTNKIISRVLHERSVKLLPGLISGN
ncbi:uncharacterized protein LOC132619809 [Lycium barbarum]|uniref:uncharacterized protein LOC132619809 n=1 Tax=Lycium barbarum TaxID=112863 RepID=UPI00293E6347|nr:uncharacterized protein LOC132619809 [Lycium barbarum]